MRKTRMLVVFKAPPLPVLFTVAEAPPMTRIRICCEVNFTREWRVFHTRMKRVNSKCSSVQLRANSTIYSCKSRLVWMHSNGAFTPDANEALSAYDLHVKSMQRRDRHPAARFAQMRWREWRDANWAFWAFDVWFARICASWKIWTLANIHAALTNQELALVVTWLRRSEQRQKSETTIIHHILQLLSRWRVDVFIQRKCAERSGIVWGTHI